LAIFRYLKIGKKQVPDAELEALFRHIDSLGDNGGSVSIDELLRFIGDKLPAEGGGGDPLEDDDAEQEDEADEALRHEQEAARRAAARPANPKMLRRFRV
jgi:hypothetical protein